MTNFPKKSYMVSLAVAGLAMLFAILAIATPEWTVTDNISIGLWTLESGGVQYSWTDTSDYYEGFFYDAFMQACRGMMMAGVMLAGMGLLYHLMTIKKQKFTMTNGVLLFGYYLVAGLLLLVTATVYSSMIPQAECEGFPTPCPEDKITSYKYVGNYGYSFWMCWIAGGTFLLPAAMVYEGGKHNLQAKNGTDLSSKILEFRTNRRRRS